jgi:hypothetical protein
LLEFPFHKNEEGFFMGRIRSVNKVKNVSELSLLDVPWEEAFKMFMSWKRAQNVSQRSLDKYEEQIKCERSIPLDEKRPIILDDNY